MSGFLTEVRGFTPIIDAVVAELGLIPAVTYGVVWRYCQMEDGVCRASLETIAEKVGVSRRTIWTHIKDLCDKGYLRDLTPDLRNVPHTYADTGKAKIRGLLDARASVQEIPGDAEGVQEIPRGCAGDSTQGVQELPMKRPSEEREEEIAQAPATPAPAKHPAIMAYRELARLWPEKPWQLIITETVGTDPPAIDRWKETVLAWLGMGWSKRNIKGMLEFYQRNEIPGAKGRASPPSIYPGGQEITEHFEIIPIPPEEVAENERRRREECERTGIPVAPPRNNSHLDRDGRPRRAYPMRRYPGT